MEEDVEDASNGSAEVWDESLEAPFWHLLCKLKCDGTNLTFTLHLQYYSEIVACLLIWPAQNQAGQQAKYGSYQQNANNPRQAAGNGIAGHWIKFDYSLLIYLFLLIAYFIATSP